MSFDHFLTDKVTLIMRSGIRAAHIPASVQNIQIFPNSTLFPYTTLFRSRRTVRRTGRAADRHGLVRAERARQARHPADWRAARVRAPGGQIGRHTSELQSHVKLVCRLLLEKKKRRKTPET